MHSSRDTDSKEARVLRAMKRTLTGVIRDTTTAPGHRHPLSDDTIEDIRQCLMLISARERELAEEAGQSPAMRPYYSDEPKKSVAVPITKIGKAKKNKKDKS
jgi:hypothetical protein